ncbi:MAG: hypothetical protein J5752_01110 [Clostridiales bacterium]|nr:hypothetical protein [Clostridiales bacterium]
MRKINKLIMTVACMACVTIIGAAGAYGYFSRAKDTNEREVVTRILIDESIPDDKGIVQWKYKDEPDENWRDIIPVRVMTDSEDADEEENKDVEFRNNGMYIEYKDKDGNWKELAALKTLEGSNDISEEIN